MKKMELLAPAGDLEKLKIAVDYGADAVYFGGEDFSLRASADNFTFQEMKEGIEYAHERGARCYLTINIFPHNEDVLPIQKYLLKIRNVGIDAFLISDPGMFDILKEVMADAEVHLSTQANMTNFRTAQFWVKMGVKRLVLARELTLEEITGIREHLPDDVELESFVHGAMCISYSGRCLLSNFMVERDSNRGMCAHPCRWKYALVEEKRPGEYYPVEEDERGTYIMNSADLCMIEHINKLAKADVMSAKIKGKMKSVFYVNHQVLYGHVFRNAIIPIITGFPGSFITAFFTGSLLIETIFSLDGMGLLAYQSVMNRDYPVVLGTLYFFTLLGLVSRLLSDLSYVLVDPRISFESQG